MALTTLANVAWALFFINSGIFQPTLVIGSTVGYRFNQTVSLDVPLPVEPSEGLLWQDLSVTTPDSTHLLHPSSGFVANGQVCGILGPCEYCIAMRCRCRCYPALPTVAIVLPYNHRFPTSNPRKLL